MNFQILFTFLSLIHLMMAAPIPEPAVVTVTAPAVTITAAEVFISNGHTYTFQLTTLRTATTTYSNLYQDDFQSTSCATPTPTAVPEAAERKDAVQPAISTFVYTSDGVVHVEVTLLKDIIVDQYGNTVTVSTQQLPSPTEAPAPAPAATTATAATLVQNEQVQHNQPAPSTSATPAETTSSSTSVSTPATTSSSTSETPTTTSSTTSTTPTTTSTASSSSSSDTNNDNATDNDFITTWANGEVFYSSLPETIVGTANVAPDLAATTTTLSNTAEAQTTNTELPLVSSGTKVVLAALTEGLPMDKNVQSEHANPATIAVTNTMSISTPVIATPTPTPTSTSTTTTATPDSNAVATDASGVLQVGSSDSSNNSGSSSSSSDSSSSSSSSSSSQYLTKTPNSIVYSPYNNDGSCKNYQSVLNDLTLIHSKGIQEIRVYGNDCNYMTTVLTIAKILNIKVNQGFWISSAGVDSIDNAVADLIKYITSGAANFGWEIFSYLTIGNEAVISNYCTTDELIGKISQVKGQLQSAGYFGLVTTSEPPVTFENHPELCTQSEIDFVGINPHSYFDASASADQAGSFVAGQIAIVKQYCGSKNIVVTETGYPSQGNTNGANVPSPANQLIAVQSILDVVGTDVTILSTYDDYWKSPGAYNIEQHFGIIQLLQ